jgi:hypothetical protein
MFSAGTTSYYFKTTVYMKMMINESRLTARRISVNGPFIHYISEERAR